ncbi:beta-N-acetylhexosaminidase [Polymorphum gilvum]|uniref:beta-N-acetylhexosaminidase n=1 Tax=Polymorphum gilvum (strain LMG 25793 / CGMCC 1.9160 / SL003B-26A1) TaxID=991905 RepID=F2IZ01_POLGS|nr:beta-N-acetylhexosaminidase [Polymorphum gilvum]ADZ70616.1 Glycoside hydrolase, family 3-like protein [Polymorphum gilvum SL003B-26A1]
MTKAFISGCAGALLSDEEAAFFAAEKPWGLILFRRNCVDPDQVRALVRAFRGAVGRGNAPVLIDQEGGRVQRLKPPHWPDYPPPGRFGTLHARDPRAGLRAAFLGARLIADDLHDLGITVDCLPLLDVGRPETVDAIGDRAYSPDPAAVAALGRATCDGLMAGGVLPVMKHIPGHGRARVDSHLVLPRVDAARAEIEAVDLAPFRALADLPLAMTAHLLYEAIDPDHPATQSKAVIGGLIRGAAGFSGCLMSDDISMQALGGSIAERAALAFSAGCDLVLHCNGDLAEMAAVAEAAPVLTGAARARCEAALARRSDPVAGFDRAAARAELDALLSAPGGEA